MSALAEVASRLRCPHCAAPFVLATSLTCATGHSFDVARQGYVSLGTGPGDTAEMVAAREAFLGAGHFAPITEVVASAHAGELVVELGAGTGHHLAALLERGSAHGIALDTSKPALKRAARAHPRLAAVACDVWAALPVQDGAADLVIDVFAPRNGPEIARILSGTLLVITPTQDHLAELIEPLGLLDVDPGKPARLHASVEPLRARTHDRVDWTMTPRPRRRARAGRDGPERASPPRRHRRADRTAARSGAGHRLGGRRHVHGGRTRPPRGLEPVRQLLRTAYDPLQMLHVHRSDRADGLVEALRALLADPPADPFAREIVCVPTRGMERWLTQRLSRRALGICANVEFPFPRRLTGEAVATASGIDPETDPWLPERLVWPLLEVVGAREPWLEAPPAGTARRFGAVRHLAELFDRYALHRPELVRGWTEAGGVAGAALRPPARPDRRARSGGAAARRVRAAPGRAGRGGPAAARLAVQPHPPARRAAARAARARRAPRRAPVPAASLADPVGADRGATPVVATRREDPTARLPRNRLLASWGQDARELQLVLGDVTSTEHPVAPATGTLLARLQAAIRADAPLDPASTIPRSRSTPATAAPARSRSCATRSCTSSPTTRRWSRAT